MHDLVGDSHITNTGDHDDLELVETDEEEFDGASQPPGADRKQKPLDPICAQCFTGPEIKIGDKTCRSPDAACIQANADPSKVPKRQRSDFRRIMKAARQGNLAMQTKIFQICTTRLGWDADAMCPTKDAAAAVGDPHLTTNSGQHYDLELLEMDDEEFDGASQPPGADRKQKPMDPICSQCFTGPDIQIGDKTCRSPDAACIKANADASKVPKRQRSDFRRIMKAARQGDLRMQTKIFSICTTRLGWDADAMCPTKDDAAAVGDPHLTTNSGYHYDLELLETDDEEFDGESQPPGADRKQKPLDPICSQCFTGPEIQIGDKTCRPPDAACIKANADVSKVPKRQRSDFRRIMKAAR